MKCLIIYQSKSGYTKRYMEMLSQLVDATLVDFKALKSEMLLDYDAIVYAAGVYAGKISGIKKFNLMVEKSTTEKLVIVAVGASPSTDEVRKKLINDNALSEHLTHVGRNAFYYLQGGFDPNKLNFALKTMLGVVSKNLQKKQLKSPESLTDEDKDFLAFFRTTQDHTSKEQLLPIVAFIDEKL